LGEEPKKKKKKKANLCAGTSLRKGGKPIGTRPGKKNGTCGGALTTTIATGTIGAPWGRQHPITNASVPTRGGGTPHKIEVKKKSGEGGGSPGGAATEKN